MKAPGFAVRLVLALLVSAARAEGPLALESRIGAGEVGGTTGPLAVDRGRGRLFAALPASEAVAVIDLQSRRVLTQVSGSTPVQGLAFAAKTTLSSSPVPDGSSGCVAPI